MNKFNKKGATCKRDLSKSGKFGNSGTTENLTISGITASNGTKNDKHGGSDS